MTWDEYNKLFHKLQLNLVAFKPLMECDAEVLKLVNAAIEQEREACAMEAEYEAARWAYSPEAREPCEEVAKAIRARGNT